jgi:hypothetical protein
MKLTELADYYDALGAARLARQCRLLTAPVDFDALVKAGVLRRVGPLTYQLLGKRDDLTRAAWARVKASRPARGGPILTFHRQRR